MKIGLIGASGRVGKLLQKLIENSKDKLVLKIEEGVDYSLIKNGLESCEVLIDFSTPKGLESYLDEAKKRNFKIPLVSGTTGLTIEVSEKLKNYSEAVPVLVESNMSLGVNGLFLVVKELAKLLQKDPSFKTSILDIHHIHKKDAPSGTALRLYELIKENSNLIGTVEDSIVSKREGEVVGEHTVTFSSKVEEIELVHRAKDRSIFAKGALISARSLILKTPGMYGMRDVLL